MAHKLTIVALILAALALGYSSSADTPGVNVVDGTLEAPLTSTAGGASSDRECQNETCHADVGGGRVKHRPVAANACTVCHKKTGGGDHLFELTANGSRLCYMCHKSLETEAVVHRPVKDGLCIACHDPHSSDNRFLLTAERTSMLCIACHVDDKKGGSVVHGPVVVGECTSCHDPHQSPHPFRLKKSGNQLCFKCHLAKVEQFETAKMVHPPARDNCGNCHDPHSTDNNYRLHTDVPNLCFICHPKKKAYIESTRTKHEALVLDKKCLNCHDPHTSQIGKQLKDKTMYLCLNCHDKEQTTPTGKVENIALWLENNPDHHGPIRQKDCAGCHDPHGSDNFRILKKYFPPKFYASFDLKNYELCFSCHLPELVLVQRTNTLTGFRNGERSLHFVHVNRMEKGRTCRACHQIHASQKKKHIRESVPFGGWSLPINYEKNDNGGRCTPGCHLSRGYDRSEPIDNP